MIEVNSEVSKAVLSEEKIYRFTKHISNCFERVIKGQLPKSVIIDTLTKSRYIFDLKFEAAEEFMNFSLFILTSLKAWNSVKHILQSHSSAKLNRGSILFCVYEALDANQSGIACQALDCNPVQISDDELSSAEKSIAKKTKWLYLKSVKSFKRKSKKPKA